MNCVLATCKNCVTRADVVDDEECHFAGGVLICVLTMDIAPHSMRPTRKRVTVTYNESTMCDLFSLDKSYPIIDGGLPQKQKSVVIVISVVLSFRIEPGGVAAWTVND